MANFVSPNQIQIQIGLVLLVRPDTCDDMSQPWLKAGAAVYFGFNAEYCVHEAVNSLEEQREEQGLPRQSREEMAKSVVCVCAEVELGRVLLFSNYHQTSSL